ncbi:hypothetical protein ABB37_05074 [Leptomonas pyrrhocoris]|uniref:Uncharacterized protein n=1 Tax=Leptomonas pyrrhocoris TaxID=157538 RepID=A0A0M9G0S0_LEPPY|nr:hypothetical protein ABB37_05074 [Leptomonas pyrrhocoris]KPA80060.1 hypothetical protein ABB37_05074 [Leptomonas pyrrhocoris]|eukprot:XP_015658499.1 hypothetical protein ABB37_05074 [Leptomonas pyrrhocoris]
MFAKLKESIGKAGKGVKGGIEKAGHSIKKGVEEANRSLTQSRSHHSSPEKKKSGLKSSAATTHDNKSEKAHTTAASERKSEQASTSAAPATTTTAAASAQASRPSSVHSDKSSKASLPDTATFAETAAGPRSRTGTPTPRPPPPPPPQHRGTPKRANSKTPVETPPAAPAAAAATPAVVEEASKLSRAPSTASANSLHLTDGDEAETPGSIRFTVEPGSAVKESTPRKAAQVEEVKEDNDDDGEEGKTADLTTEGSLDIAVEEDDDTQSRTEDVMEKVKAEPAGTKKSTKETSQKAPPMTSGATSTGKSGKIAKEEVGEADGHGTKGGKERTNGTSKPSKASTATPATTEEGKGGAKDAKVKSGTLRKATPLHTRVAGSRNGGNATRAPKKPPFSSRGGGGETNVRFAEDELERPVEKKIGKDEKKQRHRNGSRPVDGVEEEDDASDKPEAAHAASASHSRNRSSSSSLDGEGKRVDAAGEESQRQRRGFRLSPAKDDGSETDGSGSEERTGNDVRERGKARKSTAELRHCKERPSSRDISREKRREARPRDEGERYRPTSASAGARDRTQSRHSSQPSHPRERRNDLDEDRNTWRRRRGDRETPSFTTPTRAQRRGSTHRLSLRAMDGGALVEECLRDTENYARGSERRRRNSPRSSSRGHHDGETVQRRSAMQTTYQLDYPDWSRYRDESSEGDDDAFLVRVGGVSSRHAGSSRRSPPGSVRRSSPLASSSFHRLSFYDEDDALAAEAVSEPERFRAHSAARRHSRSGRRHDGYGSGGEEAVPRRVGGSRSPSSSVHSVEEDDWYGRSGGGWHERQRAYGVARQRPRQRSGDYAPPHDASSHGSERNATHVGGVRHRYDPPRPRSASRASSERRRSSVGRAEDGRLYGSWRQLTEERDDPDYYFSDAPRKRQNGGSWRSRSRGGAFAPSPPRSPLWAHRSSFGRAALGVSPNLERLQPVQRGGSSAVLSPLRGRRAGSARRPNDKSASHNTSALRTSHSRPASARSEEEILEEVEWKLDALGQQIVEEDKVRERAMMRSPFQRLYHLNNRRDRDERREKVFQLNRLERIRDRIVSGSLEEDIVRREERLRRQEEMLTNPNGVFLRLYQNTSGRRSQTGQSTVNASNSRHSTPHESTMNAGAAAAAGAASPNATGVSKASNRPGSATRRTLSKAQRLAMCDRLYGGALAGVNRKEERMKQSVEERRQREVEELLIARLVAQLQLQHAQMHPREKKAPQTLAELEQEARGELDKMRREDPKGYEDKLLRGRVLTTKEQTLMSKRLWMHGYVSKEKLEARKERDELRGCTFQPEVNDYDAFYRVKTKRGDTSDGEQSVGESEQQDVASDDTEHQARRKEVDRCKELYRKGMKAKAHEAELRDERDRETRLKILRGRMASDHHFRRRVELDPSLAERFLKSLVV